MIDTSALIEGLRYVVLDFVDLVEYPGLDSWVDAGGSVVAYELAQSVVGLLDHPPTTEG